MAHVAKHLTLDLGSIRDLAALDMEPCTEVCTDSTEPAWDSLSFIFSLSQNK